jgi:hypothetical protein
MSDKATTKPLVATGVASREKLCQKLGQALKAISQDPQAFLRMMVEEHPEMLPAGVDVEEAVRQLSQNGEFTGISKALGSICEPQQVEKLLDFSGFPPSKD